MAKQITIAHRGADGDEYHHRFKDAVLIGGADEKPGFLTVRGVFLSTAATSDKKIVRHYPVDALVHVTEEER